MRLGSLRMNDDLTGRHITIVVPAFEMGGAERQALLLARHLKDQQGALVQLWAFQRPGGVVARLCEAYGISAQIVSFDLPPRHVDKLRHIWRYALELRRGRTEVVLPFSFEANLACGLSWRFSGSRLCIWNQRDPGMHLSGRKIEHLAIWLTPQFVANSTAGRDFLVNRYGVDPKRVQIIHNGVAIEPPQESRASWRQRLGVNEDCLLVCMVANLSRNKDQATLLKAWRLVIDVLRQQNREAVLLLAGLFVDNHEALKALAYDLELGRSVRFLGMVEDITGLLKASDLGAYSSRQEGLPNGVLETMLAGLALSATDIPGVREAISPENIPYLSPVGDSAAMAQQILALLASPEVRFRVGAANRRWVQENFSVEQMCRRMTDVIKTGLSRGRGTFSA